MLPEKYRWIVEQFEPEGDPWQLLQIAQDLEHAGHVDGAASVFDRAFGIDPSLPRIREARARLLDRLAVVEHGLCFRYIPAGPFLMGSRDADPDEQPVHPVWLDAFWLAETPVSWADYCRLAGREVPPEGHNYQYILLQYCEDHTTQADEAMTIHLPPEGDQPEQVSPRPRRSDPDAPWSYQAKPMIAVSWEEGMEMARRLSRRKSGPGARYSLPTEAQWEKAARGGLIGARYPWGDEPPTPQRCDFGHYDDFVIRQSKSLPPNGYGLYAMCGGVWEWTRDWYDRDAYRKSREHEPKGPARGEEKVLRGGSWADCADAVTVSFRSSYPETPGDSPMIGFRLCRNAAAKTPLAAER